MSDYQYDFPMSIVNLFLSEVHLKKVVESMIDDVVKVWDEDGNKRDFIPPIVYNEKSKSYVVDYNFLVRSIAYYAEDESIEYDFKFFEGMSEDRKKLARFLCNSILEDMYEIVRINNSKIDIKKYRNASEIDVIVRPFHVICLKRGNNVKRINGLPFNAMKLVKLISKEHIEALDRVSYRPECEQVAFGDGGYFSYLRMVGLAKIEYLS